MPGRPGPTMRCSIPAAPPTPRRRPRSFTTPALGSSSLRFAITAFILLPTAFTGRVLQSSPAEPLLSTAACPAQSTSNSYTCPIYRAEITAVPGATRCMSGSFHLSSTGSPVDGGIWQSLNGGASWTAITDTGITNCGDIDGCGVQQGYYNLELLAVPNGGGDGSVCRRGQSLQVLDHHANPTCAATASSI